MQRSINSKETLRIKPTLMMPPAPPCMEYTVCGARGMSQKRLKMSRPACVAVLQSSCGVQGHLHRKGIHISQKKMISSTTHLLPMCGWELLLRPH